AQAAFEGPIPAGTFGATLLCLFVWLWQSGTAKSIALMGTAGSLVMCVTSASSTALLAIAASLVAVSVWPFRHLTRQCRWVLAVVLLGLHAVMKAPVWMLIGRISLVGGNSAYHRAMLVDECIRHFWDWWLIGVRSTATWGWDMWDQANQY